MIRVGSVAVTNLSGCRILIEHAMHIHRRFRFFWCGPVPLVGRFSKIRACSLTIARAKQPYAIAMKDGSPFGLAGLWENWRNPVR
jgi:hypothetical protein